MKILFLLSFVLFGVNISHADVFEEHYVSMINAIDQESKSKINVLIQSPYILEEDYHKFFLYAVSKNKFEIGLKLLNDLKITVNRELAESPTAKQMFPHFRNDLAHYVLSQGFHESRRQSANAPKKWKFSKKLAKKILWQQKNVSDFWGEVFSYYCQRRQFEMKAFLEFKNEKRKLAFEFCSENSKDCYFPEPEVEWYPCQAKNYTNSWCASKDELIGRIQFSREKKTKDLDIMMAAFSSLLTSRPFGHAVIDYSNPKSSLSQETHRACSDLADELWTKFKDI